MKSRKTRRLRLALALAASFLPTSFMGIARGHDLPTRVTVCPLSGTAWGYLVEDCIDNAPSPMPSLCPAENDLAQSTANENSLYAPYPSDASVAAEDPATIRDLIGDWSPDVDTLWSKRREYFEAAERSIAALVESHKTIQSRPALSMAAMPDEGVPPAPRGRFLLPSDTCEFAELFHMSETGKALQVVNDLARADALRADSMIAKFDRMGRIAVEQIWDLRRTTSAPALIDSSSAIVVPDSIAKSGRGAVITEIPEMPHKYAPGMTEEYAAYDFAERDDHWLSGIGKSWQVRPSMSVPLRASLASDEIATAIPVDEADAVVYGPQPEEKSDGLISNEALAALGELGEADPSFYEDTPAISNADAIDGDAEAIVDFAAEAIGVAPANEEPFAMNFIDVQVISGGLEMIEEVDCRFQGELCDFGSLYAAGEELGQLAAKWNERSRVIIDSLGSYLKAESIEVSAPVPQFVIYSDEQGHRTAVPADLARIWEQVDSVLTFAEPEALVTALGTDMDSIAMSDESSPQVTPEDMRSVGRKLVSIVAGEMESIGTGLKSAAGALSRWAEPQIASREESSVR
ncbi:MAG: hypothetical protein U0892_01655 [Pirellulales bacterium]